MADDQFDALCDGPLAPALAGLETARKQAVQRFWVIMGAGAVVAVAAIVLTRFGVLGWVIAIFAILGGWIFASMPMSKASRSLKDPALQAIGAARGLINPVVRQQLKTWRDAHGKILVRIAGDDITAAFSGKGDRFEPGSMMKAIPGRERVRAMWNDLEQAFDHLRQVRQTLG